MVGVNEIMAFEGGTQSEVDTIKMFAEMIKTGMCWKLQGFYGRTANSLIESGYISQDGTIMVDLQNDIA